MAFSRALAALAAVSIAGSPTAVFAAQVTENDGARAYQENCASCHGTDLDNPIGPNAAIHLKGPAFLAKWKNVSAENFISVVHSTMPVSRPGSLDEATSSRAANFVLAQNGLPQGQPRTSSASGKRSASAGIRPSIAEEDRDAVYKTVLAERIALLEKLRPVDDAQLAAPAAADWLGWRGSSDTHGYSRLDQIDRSNVGRLALGWSLSLEPGVNGIAPIVHDGIMFINNNGTVFALDARSGDTLWVYARPVKGRFPPNTQPRGMALYGSAIYVPTLDNHMLALDIKTGQLLWDHEIVPPSETVQLTAAPLAANGKIIQGVSLCADDGRPGGCFIVALDARTGAEVWRFNTIARPGQPGGDSWNGAPLNKRFGGSVWQTGSYDPELNLVFFGTAQTYIISTLLDDQGRKGESADALFTNTTLALDPDTGKLVWYYQHAPGDVWDLDWSFERTIIDAEEENGSRKMVVTAGKLGIFDALDAMTGQYLWSFDLGYQNVVTAIDAKTGRKTYKPGLLPPEVGKPKLVCPGIIGNRNWLSTAYSPDSRLIFVPVNPNCMDFARAATADDGSPGEMSSVARRPPDSDGMFGIVAAFDTRTQRFAWTDKQRASISSAILATAGDLVFVGERDRAFRALDSDTGKTLWRTRLAAAPNAFPLTYSVEGRQYVAVVTGGGSAVDSFPAPRTPELPRSSNSKTITVFALPEQMP